jgi:hypothetical protein
MIHFSSCTLQLRLRAASLSVLIAGLALVSAASAADLDFNVSSGNFTVVGNWTDTTNIPPVPAAAAPVFGDTAYVRNGGTVTINSDVGATEIRIGARRAITNPDYDNNGVVDANDYVLWRKGVGPLANDATPDDVGPYDYTFWRLRFGALTAENDIGGPGTLMWTDGEITGPEGFHTGGPILRVGRHVNLSATQLTEYDYPGIVTQNGSTAKILLKSPGGKLNVGDDGTTPTPTSHYNFMNGTIGLAIGGAGIEGANGNDGIAVKNGYFNMTGGQIIDATPDDLRAGTLTTQRFLTVGNQSGNVSGAPGTENYAYATFTGGVVDVLGGIRIAPSTNTRGILTINGPITITTGGDTSIGYNATNGVGEMNMSDGTLNVGRVYTDPVSGAVNSLIGRFQVGHRGRGTLNMSGGTINVTREITVGPELAAGGSLLSMTGGTINTPNFSMAVRGNNPYTSAYLGASVIIDGPTALFNHTNPNANSSAAVIGDKGKALFEVRQGTAILGGGGNSTQVGLTADTQATINVKGGKLTLGGTLLRTNTTGVAPVIGLTGGILEWNNPSTTAAQAFQADVINTGTQLITKPNTLLQVTVGSVSPAIPSNFSMTGGSWDIELGLNTVLGADWFNAQNGSASLTGGTLNLSFLSGFTPNVNQVYRILRGATGTTLGSVTINAPPSPGFHWVLQEAPITNVSFPLDEEIQLKYVAGGSGSGGGLGGSEVPEPSSVALLMFAAAGLLTARGKRSWSSAQQN